MIDPFKLVSPEYAKLLAAYLEERELTPSDFPLGLAPTNFPALLRERGYNATLAAGRPFIFLDYLDSHGERYFAKDDVEKTNPYSLARFLGPVVKWSGEDPPPKVIAQNGRANVLHYEPLADGTNWSDLPDGTMVYHFESMIKAKSLSKCFGVPCIGLNGVESFASAKRGVRFLYEDQEIDFSRFHNVVVFDSNTWKPAVRDARERLMFKFKHVLGCKDVGFIDLPKRVDGSDQGPDDFIHESDANKETLAHMLAKPDAYEGGEHSELLKRMDDAVYCTRSGTVISRKDKVVRSPAKARDYYANVNEKNVGKGGKITTTQGYQVWLESPHRTEVVNPAYEYLGEEWVYRDDGQYYNLYSRGGAWPSGEFASAQLIIDHLYRNMSESDVELMRSYLRFLKFKSQKPTSFPVMYSDKRGVGKGFFGQLATRLLGRINVRTGSSETFATKFNAELEGKRLILINELKVKGGEKDKVMNNIKTFIADPTTRIERKGVDAYEIESSTGLIINANALEDVPNDGMEDRRIWYVTCHMPEGGLTAEYWNPLYAMLEDDAAMSGFATWIERGADVDFSTWRPPMNDTRRDAILSSMGPNSVAAFSVLEKLQGDPDAWKVVPLAVIRHLMGFENLPQLNEMSDPGLSNALRRDGVWKTSDKKYGKNGEQKKVWIVDEKWMEMNSSNGPIVNDEILRAQRVLGVKSKY